MKMHTKEVAIMPCIQIQIVTYNSADCIERCLLSVINQSVNIDKLLVVDNASTDATEEIVRRFSNFVQFTKMPFNSGYVGGHNWGFSLAFLSGADFILTLNPDVILDKNYIKNALKLINSSGDLGGVTGKLIRNGNSLDKCLIDTVGLEIGAFYHVRDCGSGSEDRDEYSKAAGVWGICGAAALYRTDMLKDIEIESGMVFDEKFFIYKEDVDLCWRANRRAWVFAYQPTAVAHHTRSWVKGQRMPPKTVAHSFANQIALLIRHSCVSNYLFVTIIVETIRFLAMLFSRPIAALWTLRFVILSWHHHWNVRQRLRNNDVQKERACNDFSRFVDI